MLAANRKSGGEILDECLDNAAPTAISRTLEAITFTAHLFGFSRTVKSIADSRFLSGKAQVQMRKLGRRKQAQPISFDILVLGEVTLVHRRADAPTSLSIGGILLMVYLRARVNDLECVLDLVIMSE